MVAACFVIDLPDLGGADKLRALEMLYKHLGLGDGAKEEGVVIVDE